MTNTRTDSSSEAEAIPQPVESSSARKLRKLYLFIATSGGLGFLPKAPGTFGSLAGLVLAMVPFWGLLALGFVSRDKNMISMSFFGGEEFDPYLGAQISLALIVAILGVWSADRAAKFWRTKDPQRVVIDEVSGQHLTLLLGCGLPVAMTPGAGPWPTSNLGFITTHAALNWKYLLAGLILFRVFDIWKPFPARQAESLPGGWGIMADDWAAGIYAGLILWFARMAGL